MVLFDTHCHLTDPKFDKDLPKVLKQARESGLKAVLTVGTGIEDIKKACSIAQSSDSINIPVAGGLSPYDVKTAEKDDLVRLQELLSSCDNIAALGEIGLDRHHSYSSEEKEEEYFVLQLAIAQKLSLPVVIHCREAHARMREILKQERDRVKGRGVVHCFSGTYDDACDYLDLGMSVSFTCALGYGNASDQRETVRKIPVERIMAETDAPYLPPSGKRGKRNEPANVETVVELVAEIKNMPGHKIRDDIFGNSLEFFRITI